MKIKTLISSILYIFFAMVFIGMRVINISPLMTNFFTALMGLCALVYCFFLKGFRGSNAYLFIIGILFTISMMLSILYNGNADYLDILWIWAYMGIGTLMYQSFIPHKVYWLVFYGICGYVFLHILNGGNPDNFLKQGSPNNISAYMIFFVLAGYLSEKNERKPMKYLPVFLAFAICLWSGSRGGTLSVAVMLVGIFLCNFFVIKKGKLSSFLKAAALLAVGIALLDYFGESFISAFIQKIDRYGGDSVRTAIWTEYIQNAFSNLGNFLFGANTTNNFLVFLKAYNGNTHNAFLMLHAKFGIVSCILLASLYFRVMKKSLKKKDAVILISLAVSSIRMMFDWVAFPGLLDILFWYMLLYVLDKKQDSMSVIDTHTVVQH